MAKQGQHQNDAHDQDKSRGNNNPSKSMTITTGNVKKKETYAEQARNHEDPGKQAQAQKNEWHEDTRDPRRAAMQVAKAPTRARQGDLDSGRSGSDSNASRRSKGH
jgi:hypothetical protein